MPYCDNVHALSTDRDMCQRGCDDICKELRDLGFELHEELDATTLCQTLGGEVNGEVGLVRPTSKRLWRISMAFEYMTTAKVSYKLVQRLLGHAMTVCVINRSGMPIFRKLYDFVEHQSPPRRLYPSEVAEVWTFIGLLPLLTADMRRPWSDVITATDASPDGYGVCESLAPPGAARDLGAWNERWRFRRLPPEQWAPRKRQRGRDVLSDPVTVGLVTDAFEEQQLYYNDDFPEVDSSFLMPDRWHTVKMGRWGYKHEGITIKEGRALVIALRRLARAKRNRGKNHTIFMDNLSLCFSVAKGRAHNFGMLRIMQQIGSICLAANIGIFPRWVASEDNPADGPSRGQIRPGAFSAGVLEAAESRIHQDLQL